MQAARNELTFLVPVALRRGPLQLGTVQEALHWIDNEAPPLLRTCLADARRRLEVARDTRMATDLVMAEMTLARSLSILGLLQA